MNYKDKKYIFERRLLKTNFEGLNLFLIAQLKSCNSREWLRLQKTFKKFALKSKVVSFKNYKNTNFFSELPLEGRTNLLKGKILFLYCNEVHSLSSIDGVVKLSESVRPLLLYDSGRIVDVNSAGGLVISKSDFKKEWLKTIQALDANSLPNTLESVEDSIFSALRLQSALLMNILEYKIANESKF